MWPATSTSRLLNFPLPPPRRRSMTPISAWRKLSHLDDVWRETLSGLRRISGLVSLLASLENIADSVSPSPSTPTCSKISAQVVTLRPGTTSPLSTDERIDE